MPVLLSAPFYRLHWAAGFSQYLGVARPTGYGRAKLLWLRLVLLRQFFHMPRLACFDPRGVHYVAQV